MAKRHQSLIGLSHDHHHGLALALRLQLGDRAMLVDGWTHDRRKQAEKVVKFFDEELAAHFALEEEVLFPVIVCHTTDASALVTTLISQHRQMEKLAGRLRSETDVEQVLLEMGRLLEMHIRLEERELFPQFEQHVPETVAREVGQLLDRSQKSPTPMTRRQ